jgi:small subunit ribosomal protein S1
MDANDKAIGEEILSPQEDNQREGHPMDALLEADAYELETPRRGEIRTGTIARISENDVLVDVGAKSEGVIPNRELEQLSEEERADLDVGQEVEVYVIRSADRDGTMLLSLSRAEEEQDWRDVEAYMESRETLDSTVAGYNKGGLIVKHGRLRGFIPASQVSLSRRRRSEGETPDQRWGKMVGEPIVTRVIEVDRRRNRLILSEKAAAREARDALKERLIAELTPGEEREGTVISLADFGAFVDIGGADGLIHISEISWKRVDHPKEILKVGQDVKVKVLNIDEDRNRISLSLRELESNPWDELMAEFTEGQLVEGTITKLTKFGAFAAIKGLEDFEIEGLVHISELSDRRIEHPKEVVEENQTVALRLIKIDRDRRRIGLSLKRVDSAEYADIDWKTAMQEIESPDDSAEPVAEPEVEDFDAALETDITDVAPAELEALSEEIESEMPADEAAEEDEPEAEIEGSEPESAAEDAESEIPAEEIAEEDEPEAEIEGSESESAAEDAESEIPADEATEEDEPEAAMEDPEPEPVIEDAESEMPADEAAEEDEPEAEKEDSEPDPAAEGAEVEAELEPASEEEIAVPPEPDTSEEPEAVSEQGSADNEVDTLEGAEDVAPDEQAEEESEDVEE